MGIEHHHPILGALGGNRVQVNRYQIFMYNDTVSKTYLSKSLSPLGGRVMALFDTVEGKNHQYTMYNIYNSATFFKAEYNH